MKLPTKDSAFMRTMRVAIYFVVSVTLLCLNDETTRNILLTWFPGLTAKLGALIAVVTYVRNLVNPNVKNW